MIARLRRGSRNLTVPHVLSALALFVALGGTAVAVGIAKNSVGSQQIKPGAVRTSDIRDGAVARRKIRSNAVTTAKVEDASLTGADINQTTLRSVRAANVIGISAEGDGECTLLNPPAGVTAESEGTGKCAFTFSRSVAACQAVASADLRLPPNSIAANGARTVFVKRFNSEPSVIRTQAYFDSSTAAVPPGLSDTPLSLVLVC